MKEPVDGSSPIEYGEADAAKDDFFTLLCPMCDNRRKKSGIKHLGANGHSARVDAGC